MSPYHAKEMESYENNEWNRQIVNNKSLSKQYIKINLDLGTCRWALIVGSVLHPILQVILAQASNPQLFCRRQERVQVLLVDVHFAAVHEVEDGLLKDRMSKLQPGNTHINSEEWRITN